MMEWLFQGYSLSTSAEMITYYLHRLCQYIMKRDKSLSLRVFCINGGKGDEVEDLEMMIYSCTGRSALTPAKSVKMARIIMSQGKARR